MSHARAIGGCSSDVNTLDAWSAISNSRCVLQSAATSFPLQSPVSLPPFHCDGIVLLATTRFMTSLRSSASLSPPAIQISLASASGPTACHFWHATQDLGGCLGRQIKNGTEVYHPHVSVCRVSGVCNVLHLRVSEQRSKVLCPPCESFLVVFGQGSVLESHSRYRCGFDGSKPSCELVAYPSSLLPLTASPAIVSHCLRRSVFKLQRI